MIRRRLALAVTVAVVGAVLVAVALALPAGAAGWTCPGVPGTGAWGCHYAQGSQAAVGLGSPGDQAVITAYAANGSFRWQIVDTVADGVNVGHGLSTLDYRLVAQIMDLNTLRQCVATMYRSTGYALQNVGCG